MNTDISEMSLSAKMIYGKLRDGQRLMSELDECTKNPMKAQEEFLLEWLDKNKNTEYGKKYHFADIHNIAEYMQKVPVTGFDDYAEYISREADGCEKNLLCSEEMFCYAKTSGTVGVPKRIPTTVYHKDDATSAFNGAYQYALVAKELGMDWIGPKMFSLIECPENIHIMKNGLPHCAVSSVKLNSLRGNPLLSQLYVSPEEAIITRESTESRYLHARFSLAYEELTVLTATFTSFLLNYFRYIEKNWKMITDDIEKGTIDESVKLDSDIRAQLEERLVPMPERAAALRQIFEKGFDEPIANKVWPKLTYTAFVGTASFEPYLEKLYRYIGKLPKYFFGIGASEGFFTVPYELDNPNGVFVPQINFYEFLPEEAGGDLSKTLTLDQIEVGKEYELIVTNLSGFYRYRMRDIIRVTGMINNTPTAQFIRRIDKTISVMGEKTTETALRDAAYSTAKQCGFDLVDFSVYPDNQSDPPRYVFYFEAENMPDGYSDENIRDILEKNLAIANPSMGDKVSHGTCAPTVLRFLQPETYLLYQEVMFARGGNRSQIKPVTVIGNEFQRKFFSGLSAEKYADAQ